MTIDTSRAAVEAMEGREKISPSEHLNKVSRVELKVILDQKSSAPNERGCVEWAGEISSGGYGRVYYKGYRYQAHRVSWVCAHGPMPLTCDACHICDNRRCVNPHHIVAGSRKANMIDAVNKGRVHAQISPETMPKKTTHGMAKLTLDQVTEIRRLDGSGRQVAEKYGVSASTVLRIKRGELWKDSSPIRARAAAKEAK